MKTEAKLGVHPGVYESSPWGAQKPWAGKQPPWISSPRREHSVPSYYRDTTAVFLVCWPKRVPCQAAREGKGLRVYELLLKEVFLLESPLRNVNPWYFSPSLAETNLDFLDQTIFRGKRKDGMALGNMYGGGMGFRIEWGPVRLQTPCVFSQTEEGGEPFCFLREIYIGARLVGLPWTCALTGSNS